MIKYVHKVQYYETDKMGIPTTQTIFDLWKKPACIIYADRASMTSLEEAGITSPVVSVHCDYKHTTTYSDEIEIEVSVSNYTGARLMLDYTMAEQTNRSIGSNCLIC